MKYDWYQTDTHVFVNILTKNCKKEDTVIDIKEQFVKVVRSTDDNTEEVSLQLFNKINEQQATYKLLASKIEIKLPKKDGGRWDSLESEQPVAQKCPKKNWDSIAVAADKEDDEKAEGDQALNQLFQKIYQDADENTKKAMNKSYMESGGTVLSTNWGEVGDKTVEMKAPDGMEFKKWEK